MDDAQAAEIAVFGAERTIRDRNVLNQLRAERLERAEVALAMGLRRLILLHIVHQHLESAIHAAVIEVEAEAADLEGFAAAFMLAGIDSGVELLKELVIARKQGAVEDLGVAKVELRLRTVRPD